MEHKFKVGDRVITKADCYQRDNGTERPKGYVFTIAEIDGVSYRENVGVMDGLGSSEIELCKKDWDTLEVGDIIVDTDGEEAKVLAVLGDVFLRSCWKDFRYASDCWSTKKYAEDEGWKIKGAEETDTVKMTVSEVSKLVGKKVEIIEE